jgi:hypothetical protein
MRGDVVTWTLAGALGVVATVAACSGETSEASPVVSDAGDGTGDDAGDGADAAVTTPDASTGVHCGVTNEVANATLNLTSLAKWTCTETTRALASNGIPDHAPGTFPSKGNPNTIRAQTISTSMPLAPAQKGTNTNAQIFGYALNGVKYEPGTAGTCTVTGADVSCNLANGTGTWRIEALGQSSFDFGVDAHNAHVQPNGEYHYHGLPVGMIARLAKGESMTLVGFAMDGFPIYATYGYAVATDATAKLVELRGSYRLKATPDAGRPPVDTYAMGAFRQDWEYAAGSGDLDECNGRTGVTPEFPGGTYHYVITSTYPYIGRCVKGTPIASSTPGGGPPGGGPPTDGGPPPDGGP